jgi:hypothetical protein
MCPTHVHSRPANFAYYCVSPSCAGVLLSGRRDDDLSLPEWLLLPGGHFDLLRLWHGHLFAVLRRVLYLVLVGHLQPLHRLDDFGGLLELRHWPVFGVYCERLHQLQRWLLSRHRRAIVLQ